MKKITEKDLNKKKIKKKKTIDLCISFRFKLFFSLTTLKFKLELLIFGINNYTWRL